jgi:hypothetical protein
MSKIKKGLETAVKGYAKAVAKSQLAVDKILWGNRALVNIPKIDDKNKKVEEKNRAAASRPTQRIVARGKEQLKNQLEKGLFPNLDELLAVDLCNIIEYLYSLLARPTERRSEQPTELEKALYKIQDGATAVVKGIDTFTSAPDRLIGRFITGGDADVIDQQQARQQTTAPTTQTQSVNSTEQQNVDIAGNSVKKFNLVQLVQYIQTTFTDILSVKDVDGKQILEPEEKALLTAAPEMQSILTFMNDVVLGIQKYTDYRNINDEDFQKALQKINQLRAICVTIQNLSLRDPSSFLSLIPPSIIQKQLESIQKVVDPTDLLPFIKRIDGSINSFIKTVEQVEGAVLKSQFIIKIAIILIKVFRVIIAFLRGLPLPSFFTTAGIVVTLSGIVEKFDRFIKDLVDILKQINALLSTTVAVIRYIQSNTESLKTRLDNLTAILSSCESMKNSPVLQQLQQTNQNLQNLQTSLQTILTNYDGRINPSTTTFGSYTIQVIDEEVVDEGITNRRRRGIALDKQGKIALQSDLTFATNLAVIIQEVKVKLVSAGLVQPGLGQIDTDIEVITESLSFLTENDLTSDDLNFQQDAGASTGLGSFINDLKGGRQLRKRVRARMDSYRSQFNQQVAIQKGQADIIFRPTQPAKPAGALSRFEVQIYDNGNVIRVYTTSASSESAAIQSAKTQVDPSNTYPNWKYVAKKIG